MDEQEREDVFVNNILLGTDAFTGWAAATDHDPKPSKRQGAGCLPAILLIVAGVVGLVITVGL